MANGKPPLSTRKKIAFTLIVFSVFSLLIILIGEIIIRNFYKKEYGPPPRAMTDFFYSEKDDLLGWKIKPDFSLNTKTVDKAGVEYELKLNYNENGFKAFGNINSEKPKVFFIGDSYTASVEVSNEIFFLIY